MGGHNPATLGAATVTYCLFTGLTGALFLAAPQGPLTDSFPEATEGTPASSVGQVWVEVVGMISLSCCLRQCPGSMGYFMASVAHVALMSKHFFVNGLVPPPPVIAMGTLTLLLCTYSHFVSPGSKAGMWMFLLNYSVTAATFHLAPELPLADTYPDMAAGSPEHTISLVYMKVVGSLSIAAALTTCPPPLGPAMSLGAIAAQMAYDMQVTGVSPPLPAMGLCGLACACSWGGLMLSGTGHGAAGAAKRD